MRRRSPESVRRWRALSTAERAPRSRKSFGVQTNMDLSRVMRSRMARLRSRLEARRGGVVCPIFVDIFRTAPQCVRPKNVYSFRTNSGYHRRNRNWKAGGTQKTGRRDGTTIGTTWLTIGQEIGQRQEFRLYEHDKLLYKLGKGMINS